MGRTLLQSAIQIWLLGLLMPHEVSLQIVMWKKNFTRTSKMQSQSANTGLKSVKVDVASIWLAIFWDDSFPTNSDLTAKLEFVVLLTDKFNNTNILHYTSVKSKRVTRSVLAAEIFAAIFALDYTSTLQVTLNKSFGKTIPTVLHTDSKSLYAYILGINDTSEKTTHWPFYSSTMLRNYESSTKSSGSLLLKTQMTLWLKRMPQQLSKTLLKLTKWSWPLNLGWIVQLQGFVIKKR